MPHFGHARRLRREVQVSRRVEVASVFQKRKLERDASSKLDIVVRTSSAAGIIVRNGIHHSFRRVSRYCSRRYLSTALAAVCRTCSSRVS
jgi:hypothetical protein